MPFIGFGTYALRGTDGIEAITSALELGYRHIDTAKMYGNEAEVAAAISQSGIPRQDIFITTKLLPLSLVDVEAAIDQRLQLLKTDYIDLLLIHWPPPSGVAAEMWQLMAAEQRAGVLHSIGVSNYSIEQIINLVKLTKVKPAVNQIELSPFTPQEDLRAFCQQQDIVIEAYSPLTQQTRLNHPLITDLADKYERSPAQIMLRWCVQHGTVPLPKASTRRHQEDNLNIFDFQLNSDDMLQLDSLGD